MENENKEKKDWTFPVSIAVAVIAVIIAFVYRAGESSPSQATAGQSVQTESAGGAILPVTWGDLGTEMVQAGVIDPKKFEAVYAGSGGLDAYEHNLLYGENNGRLVINGDDAGMILNLLWALGLSTKNPILENGPITDPQYGGAGGFASTGGWTIAVGDAMYHFDAHPFIALTADEQALVEKVAQNIYRPCCDNSTYFPDCNHGMAMLGFLELMASQGASEGEMYKDALVLNQYWFPDTYANIAKYFEGIGQNYADIDPKVILGKEYSSVSGYNFVLSQIKPTNNPSSGNCGVQ